MTKKDFVLIARTINSLFNATVDDKRAIAEHFARAFDFYLATTNPRFDGQRFIDACIK
jgi:hypothetical protein